MDSLKNALDAQINAAIDLETLVKEVQEMPKVVRYETSVKNQLSVFNRNDGIRSYGWSSW